MIHDSLLPSSTKDKFFPNVWLFVAFLTFSCLILVQCRSTTLNETEVGVAVGNMVRLLESAQNTMLNPPVDIASNTYGIVTGIDDQNNAMVQLLNYDSA